MRSRIEPMKNIARTLRNSGATNWNSGQPTAPIVSRTTIEAGNLPRNRGQGTSIAAGVPPARHQQSRCATTPPPCHSLGCLGFCVFSRSLSCICLRVCRCCSPAAIVAAKNAAARSCCCSLACGRLARAFEVLSIPVISLFSTASVREIEFTSWVVSRSWTLSRSVAPNASSLRMSLSIASENDMLPSATNSPYRSSSVFRPHALPG